MRRWLLVLCAACGGSDEPEGPTCRADEHRVRATCVPNVFDDVVAPPPADGASIMTAADGTRFVGGTLLVFVRDGADADALAGRHGARVIGRIPFAGFAHLAVDGATDEASLTAARTAIAAEPEVEYASFDQVHGANALTAIPPRDRTDLEDLTTDQLWERLDDVNHNLPQTPVGPGGKWAWQRIRMPEAWTKIHDKNPKTSEVVVGMLDGPVFKDSVFPNLAFAGEHDWRVLGPSMGNAALMRHGNSVASILAAPTDGKGINGAMAGLACTPYDLAPQTVLAKWGPEAVKEGVSDAAVFYGLAFAVKEGARVVNVSLGSYVELDAAQMPRDNYLVKHYHFTKRVRLVIAKAERTLFVFGAGNDGRDASLFWPAAAARTDEDTQAPNAMSIAATDESEARATFFNGQKTNFSTMIPSAVTLAAPGVKILAQLPEGTLTMFEGTSGSAPLVAGTAGLMMAVNKDLLGAEAKQMLVETADTITDAGLSGKRLNAEAAVSRAMAGVEGLGKGSCRPPDPDPPKLDIDTVCISFENSSSEEAKIWGLMEEPIREHNRSPGARLARLVYRGDATGEVSFFGQVGPTQRFVQGFCNLTNAAIMQGARGTGQFCTSNPAPGDPLPLRVVWDGTQLVCRDWPE